MTSASTTRPWTAHFAALAVAVVVLGAGLGRFGIWQPAELRMADLARGEGTARESQSRPPAQIAAVRIGFNNIGPTEVGGRLPTAILAILATMALAFSVASASEARTGAFVAIAYVTLPLVFMNARMMFGGGVAQSGFTIFLSAGMYALWGRPPPGISEDAFSEKPAGDTNASGGAANLWLYGRWLLLATMFFAASAAGWMLGVAPVLLGLGAAAMLRWRYELRASRVAGVVLAVLGAVLLFVCIKAAIAPHQGYSALTGVGNGPEAPRPLPTYEALIEHVGHGTFPWTGIVAFGLARLMFAPPTAGLVKNAGAPVDVGGAWRESGMRLAAFTTVAIAFGVQSFHLQQFGMTPFIAVAPLAIAAGIALRDAEREAQPWRLVVAGATFFTVIMMRDYIQFPKVSYAALGLADGGPSFPTGFTASIKDWFKARGGNFFVAMLKGNAPGEVYFALSALLFIVFALSPLFQGAGRVARYPWDRPFTWLGDVERDARASLAASPHEAEYRPQWIRYVTPGVILANLRAWVFGVGLAMFAVFGTFAAFGRGMSTPARGFLSGLALLPVAIVLGTFGVLVLWKLWAWAGDPDNALMRLVGSRVVFVLAAAVLVALMTTQLFIPALSEHLSPRGVWAVIRTIRRGNEPVARFGGQQNDRATRYYANFEVNDVRSEGDAVEWLRTREPRHFMVVGADVFPSLNSAYRRSLPAAERRNIPVIDASNSNLYVAASDAGDRPSRNPLDEIVMTVDRDASGRLWHPHGRTEGGRLIEDPARFNESIEYRGFNLDSNNQSYVNVGGSFKLTMHFRALRQVAGDHQIFIHVDGPCPRINGDHPPAGGRYPVRFWLPGDFVHDEYRITIPSYCRPGSYYVYMGFFQGDDRMQVTGGDHDRENRVVAARVNVR